MSKISIKIVEVHQPSRSVVVKFASEDSAKSIDEYEGLAFTVPNFDSFTPQEFIEKISGQITKLVKDRDSVEKRLDTIDVTSWNGYTTEFDAVEDPEIDPVLANQILLGLANPEVEL